MSRLKVHPQRDETVEVKAEQESPIVEENSAGKLEQGMLAKILLPITFSMRVFGLYFEKTDKLRMTQQYSRLYCLLILVIMWFNAIRIFTIFTRDDILQSALEKISGVVWIVAGAIVQTACYRASQNGRILEELQTFNKDMNSDMAKQLRVKVISCVVIAWFYTAFAVVSTAYGPFNNSQFRNLLLAPYNTMILDASPLTINIVSSLYLVLEFYVTGTVIISLMWIYLLSAIISHKFKTCTEMMHDIVKTPESAKNNLEMVRCRHQVLCRMVDNIDGCVCVNNATYVVSLICEIILNLYSVIAYLDLRSRPFFLLASLLWISSCVLGLTIVAHGGIMINQSVRVP